MASVYQNIRGALQSALAAISGLPTIVYESQDYSPNPGTPFITAALVPGSGRPASMGPSHAVLHEGSFEINVVWPRKRDGVASGTGPAEAIADSIKAAFHVSNVFTLNDVTVRTRYAERIGAAMIEPDWLRLPIRVSWYSYDFSY